MRYLGLLKIPTGDELALRLFAQVGGVPRTGSRGGLPLRERTCSRLENLKAGPKEFVQVWLLEVGAPQPDIDGVGAAVVRALPAWFEPDLSQPLTKVFERYGRLLPTGTIWVGQVDSGAVRPHPER